MASEKPLVGKTCLVFGESHVIGRYTVAALLSQGASTVYIDGWRDLHDTSALEFWKEARSANLWSGSVESWNGAIRDKGNSINTMASLYSEVSVFVVNFSAIRDYLDYSNLHNIDSGQCKEEKKRLADVLDFFFRKYSARSDDRQTNVIFISPPGFVEFFSTSDRWASVKCSDNGFQISRNDALAMAEIRLSINIIQHGFISQPEESILNKELPQINVNRLTKDLPCSQDEFRRLIGFLGSSPTGGLTGNILYLGTRYHLRPTEQELDEEFK